MVKSLSENRQDDGRQSQDSPTPAVAGGRWAEVRTKFAANRLRGASSPSVSLPTCPIVPGVAPSDGTDSLQPPSPPIWKKSRRNAAETDDDGTTQSTASACFGRHASRSPARKASSDLRVGLQQMERLIINRLDAIDAKLSDLACKNICSGISNDGTPEVFAKAHGQADSRPLEIDSNSCSCLPHGRDAGLVEPAFRLGLTSSDLWKRRMSNGAAETTTTSTPPSKEASDASDATGDTENHVELHVKTIESSEHMRSAQSQFVRNSIASCTSHSLDFQFLQRFRHNLRAVKISSFLEDPRSSYAAMIYSRCMLVLIITSVCMPLLQTLRSPPLSALASAILETAFDVTFLTETSIRWLVYPGCCGFLQFPYNALDLAIAGPLLVRIMIGFGAVEEHSFAQVLLFCIVPLLRLAKALRAFPNLKLVYYALSRTREALTVPLFLVLVLTLVFSALIFLVEPRENIETMPHAMWFVIVTITTVGYGDVTPETHLGKMVASILSITGVLYMAMPLTIVGTAFEETWKNRNVIILGGLMRQRMVQWGLSEQDLDAMFKHFDVDASGELDADEFLAMVTEMQLGLSKGSILQIFKAFDHDRNGSIRFDDLAQIIFPDATIEE